MAKVIDALLALHRIDQEIRDIDREAQRLPAALSASEQELAAAELRKAELLAAAREEQVAADRSNVEVRDLEARQEKYQSQLNIAKTQKEYDTLRGEIAAVRESISALETGALTAYEAADALTGQAGELNPRIAALRAGLAAARAELDGKLAELAACRAGLVARRAGQARAVAEEALRLYEQILVKQRDAAMVRVEAGRCSVCNIRMTPQSFDMVLIGEKPQQCRSCGRICFCDSGLEEHRSDPPTRAPDA